MSATNLINNHRFYAARALIASIVGLLIDALSANGLTIQEEADFDLFCFAASEDDSPNETLSASIDKSIRN